MNVELTTSEIQTVSSILAEHLLPKCEVYVYGSRARGDSRASSDLDLVLKNTNSASISMMTIAKLMTQFEYSNLPFSVDISIWDELPSTFQQHIQDDLVVFEHEESKANCT